MKFISIQILFGVVLVADAFSQTWNMKNYKQAVDDLYRSLPVSQQSEPRLSSKSWRELPAYHELVISSSSSWRSILDHLAEVAPDDAHRTLVLQSLSEIAPNDYLGVLDRLIKLSKDGEIASLDFDGVFYPAGAMRNFLAYNYSDPKVVALLNKIKDAHISNLSTKIAPEILSGKTKEKAIYFRKTHPEYAKPIPLLSGGYAPPDPDSSLTPDPMSAPLWRSQNPKATPPPGMLRSSMPTTAASTPRPMRDRDVRSDRGKNLA